ncbi:MAG: hypothetical protein LBN10_00085 [Propionibacteriaceae bacterium]|nr:hypothetical protein [Propionibacteriaceae bacterium]
MTAGGDSATEGRARNAGQSDCEYSVAALPLTNSIGSESKRASFAHLNRLYTEDEEDPPSLLEWG